MEEIKNSDFKILMVDDTPKNLQVLGSTLRNHEYKVEFATNGKQAMEWIKKKDFDLILLDIMMPEMDGFEVCATIRNDEKYKNLPIIFLTAKTDRESIIKGFDVGAQDYVTKPFDSGELLARVKTQLELKYSKEKLLSTNQWLEEKVSEKTLELKLANDQLRNVNEDLLNLDNAKVEFLHLISHELRTPLNGMLAPLHLLKDKTDSEEIMKLIDHMDASVKSLEEFSYNALLITNLLAKKRKPEITEISSKELIEMSIMNVSDLLSEKNISINFNLVNDIKMKGDYELLMNAFKNIFLSTINYSAENSEVEITINIEGGLISYEVIKKGNGFPENVTKLSSIFSGSDFELSNKASIGLYLSKLILDTHEGVMEIKNLKEGGAVTRLIFKN